MNSCERFFQTRRGWLFSLSADPGRGSSWGSVVDFFYDIDENGVIEGDSIFLETSVHGRTLNKDCHVEVGDGIAFYHSKRAKFTRFHIPDEHHGRQRISLMGIVEGCEQGGVHVSSLKVLIPRDIEGAFASGEEAIVWTPEMDDAFVACGLRDGPVAAFYPVPPTAWQQFLVKAEELVDEYTGE